MSWTAKKGKYIHQDGCGAGPDEPCTCEPPFPIDKNVNPAHAAAYALYAFKFMQLKNRFPEEYDAAMRQISMGDIVEEFRPGPLRIRPETDGNTK